MTSTQSEVFSLILVLALLVFGIKSVKAGLWNALFTRVPWPAPPSIWQGFPGLGGK